MKLTIDKPTVTTPTATFLIVTRFFGFLAIDNLSSKIVCVCVDCQFESFALTVRFLHRVQRHGTTCRTLLLGHDRLRRSNLGRTHMRALDVTLYQSIKLGGNDSPYPVSCAGGKI